MALRTDMDVEAYEAWHSEVFRTSGKTLSDGASPTRSPRGSEDPAGAISPKLCIKRTHDSSDLTRDIANQHLYCLRCLSDYAHEQQGTNGWELEAAEVRMIGFVLSHFPYSTSTRAYQPSILRSREGLGA
jgi:hypothetical protein